VKKFWSEIGLSCRSINSSRPSCVQAVIQSAHYFCSILKKAEFLPILLVRNSSIKYHKTAFSGSQAFHADGRTDVHVETTSHFSQLY